MNTTTTEERLLALNTNLSPHRREAGPLLYDLATRWSALWAPEVAAHGFGVGYLEAGAEEIGEAWTRTDRGLLVRVNRRATDPAYIRQETGLSLAAARDMRVRFLQAIVAHELGHLSVAVSGRREGRVVGLARVDRDHGRLFREAATAIGRRAGFAEPSPGRLRRWPLDDLADEAYGAVAVER